MRTTTRFPRIGARAPEVLENRWALDGDGLLAGDPPYLTLSFAPDGTDIGGKPSQLHHVMSGTGAPSPWRQAVLSAFQNWAARTNGDIGEVADGGQPFGAEGELRRDPRFGDIRIGAIPMRQGVYAVTVPRGVTSGTWEGDVIFNSNQPWTSVDQVFRVALHEAGHVLGLDESTDPQSPMYFFGIPTSITPTVDDLAELRRLSGLRGADSNEDDGGNDMPANATQLRDADCFDGTRPIVVYGDLLPNDIDVFELNPMDAYTGPVTFRLRTQGISQLAAQLLLTDEYGNIVGIHPGGDPLAVTISVVASADIRFYATVMAIGPGPAAVGGYSLVATYDSTITMLPSVIDTFADGRYRFLDQDDLMEAIHGDCEGEPDDDFPLLNNDLHANDTPATATELETTAGFEENRRFEFVGSISDVNDVDVYLVRAPETLLPSEAMVIVLDEIAANGLDLDVQVLDQFLQPLPVEELIRHRGRTVVQVAALDASQHLFVRLSRNPQSEQPSGNYRLMANFGDQVTSFQPLGAGQLTDTSPVREFQLQFTRPRLVVVAFHGAELNPQNRNVAIEILDAQGTVLRTITSPSSSFRSSDSILLTRGRYRVRARLLDANPLGTEVIDFDLSLASVIDPLAAPLNTTSGPIAVASTEEDDVFVFPAERGNQELETVPLAASAGRPHDLPATVPVAGSMDPSMSPNIRYLWPVRALPVAFWRKSRR